jgi:hypothetical protein
LTVIIFDSSNRRTAGVWLMIFLQPKKVREKRDKRDKSPGDGCHLFAHALQPSHLLDVRSVQEKGSKILRQ